MDEYPAYSLEHNVPLLVTIGLPLDEADALDAAEPWPLSAAVQEQAIVLQSALPVLPASEQVVALQQYLIGDTGPASPVAPWRGRANVPRYQFRVRAGGRTYRLPPRRAALPSNFEVAPGAGPVVLHSPFSPLSPACGLYADGIMEVGWIQKHQALIPSVFLCCYALAGGDASSRTTADDRVRADIAAFRAAVAQSGYRSRVAVVVLDAAEGPAVLDRLEAIRRGSNTEAKLFFALSAGASADEVSRVAENLLTTMGQQALEYYRDLGRHVRKKRGRGTAPQPSVPPTNGTSQTLSLAGWHMRYDCKAAVFAEFRQEPDAALRALDAAYGALLGGGGTDALLEEAVPSWSPRWNEARLLADVLAVRGLRCLLAGGHASAAVRRWESHRDRMRALVDGRGRGSANYGFAAWEARWARVMADLIERTVPALAAGPLYLAPDKALAAATVERLPPWHRLHHAGYWHRLAAGHVRRRRTFARAIPEDDRRPPDASPATQVARRAFVYDDYMCPPPHEEYATVDHGALLVARLLAARDAFTAHHQPRTAREVALEAGRELAAAARWQEALALLEPLWTGTEGAYRDDGWRGAAEALARTLRTVAAALGRADLLVAVAWELLHAHYGHAEGDLMDVARALDDLDRPPATPLDLALDQPPSGLSATFAFQRADGNAGHAVAAQLAVHSNAPVGAVPIVLAAVCVRFEGAAVKPLLLQHAAGTVPTRGDSFAVVALTEHTDGDADDALTGACDLTLRPQSAVVVQVAIPLRAAGDARAVVAELTYRCANYTLRLAVPFSSGLAGRPTTTWLLSSAARRALPRPDGAAIHVLPRPPKLTLALEPSAGGARPLSTLSTVSGVSTVSAASAATAATADTPSSPPLAYYTNEPVDLAFVLCNAEDTAADVHLDVVLFGDTLPAFVLHMDGAEVDTAAAAAGETALRSVPLGVVAAGRTVRIGVHVTPMTAPAAVDVSLRAVYTLVGDPGTAISQTLSVAMRMTHAFEANYDLLPRRHGAAWPSLFDVGGLGVEDETSYGLAQAWTLVARYASFAAEELRIVGLALAVQPVAGVVCESTRRKEGSEVKNERSEEKEDEEESEEESEQSEKKSEEKKETTLVRTMPAQSVADARFDLDVRRARLDQRESVSLDVAFVLHWQRAPTTARPTPPINTTTLPVPRLAIFGTEPRVLASVTYGGAGSSPVLASQITLTLTIENASSHFLTFGLSMEPSTAFAFAGAKLTTVHVLPVSRRTQTYRLLPLVRQAWLRPPLVVRDKYFQKVLRILPTEGLKADKEGLLVWVPAGVGEA